MAKGLVPMAFALALCACGGGGGGGADGGTEVEPSPDAILAQADIGPAGGRLAVTGGPNAGTSLTVPAGAIAAPTRVTLSLDGDNDRIPSLFPVYRFDAGSVVLQTGPIVVSIRAGELLPQAGAASVSLFTRATGASAWTLVPGATFDPTARTMTGTVGALGEFVVWDGILHRLFTQDFELHDPATATGTDTVGGVNVVVDNGARPLQIGKGSVSSFFASPAADNVLILHGLFGSPLDFLGAQDLVDNMSLSKQNVLLLSYPSATGIADAANHLYDLIAARARPGFGCSIVGHSLGGLVGRYLIERSAQDTARAGHSPNDPSLAGVVDRLILLGVPNAGAREVVQPLVNFSEALPAAQQGLLQVAVDLGEAPGSLPLQMNQTYVDNATVYHIICGDIGDGSDGVVSLASALALPLTPPETFTVFPAGHDELHTQATSLGIAVLIGTLLQAP